MGLGTWLKGILKIGGRSAGEASSAAKAATRVNNFNRIVVEKGGRYYAEGARAVGKAAGAVAPGLTTATKTITAGAVAVGALIIATLSGIVTYILTSGELIPGTGLSMMDLIILGIVLVLVLIVIRKIRKENGDGHGPSDRRGGRSG